MIKKDNRKIILKFINRHKILKVIFQGRIEVDLDLQKTLIINKLKNLGLRLKFLTRKIDNKIHMNKEFQWLYHLYLNLYLKNN